MSRVADELGTGASFGRARPVSARRAATAAVTGAHTEGVPDPTELPVGLISQNPDNPRDHMRDLEEMTQSVRELGVINAITVANTTAWLEERPDRAGELEQGARYLVVDGHRRLEAARRAGKATIKVMVDNARVATDESLLEAAFVANFHRDNMTELEEAHALESLVKFYGGQSKASKRLGMPQSTISQKLSILKVTPELQADLTEGRRKVEHVRNLGKLAPDEQRRQADARAEEARVRAANKKTPKPTPAKNEMAPQPLPVAAAVPSAEPIAVASSTPEPAAPPPHHEPAREGPGESEPEPLPELVTADAVRWGDPDAVYQMIRQRMRPADVAALGKLIHDGET